MSDPRTPVVFRYVFNGTVFTSPDVSELARIDEARLTSELGEIPSQIAYWGAVAADVESRLSCAETDFEITKARLDKQIRSTLSAPESKTKVTERVIETEMLLTAEYRQWEESLRGLKFERDNIVSVCTSLRAKLTALTTLAGIRRSEADAYNRVQV